jgi:HlyD family secretion protein
MKKLLLTTIALVAAVIGLGVAIEIQSTAPVVRPAQSGDARQIYASGRIEGATSEIELRLQAVGRITQVPVCEGQVVKAGDLLIQLDDQQYRQEIALAGAELVLAEAQLQRLLSGAHPQQRNEAASLCRAREAELKRAELTWQRTQEMLRDKTIAQQEADNQWMHLTALRNEVDAARARLAFLESSARPDEIRIEEARIAAAKARVESSKVQADHTRLLAPCNAQVLKLNGKVGEMTGPTSVEPAAILADTSRYFVRAFVEERDAPRVAVGMPAKITLDALRDQTLTGRVVRLSPRMDRKSVFSDRATERYDTKTRTVWIELPPGPSLVLGLRVDVTIDATSGPRTGDRPDSRPENSGTAPSIAKTPDPREH